MSSRTLIIRPIEGWPTLLTIDSREASSVTEIPVAADPATIPYEPLPGGWDETVDAAGAPRPQWRMLAAAFGRLGVEELGRRGQDAARLLEQDGVVYHSPRSNGSNGSNGTTAAGRDGWRLDPLPLVIPSREWQQIESGVIERAELLSLVLEDLYGPRELLRRRVLPAELVLGQDGFLRACDQIRIPGGQQLFSYAADIGRDSSGEPVVVADRAQAPSGAGYALENRLVLAKVIPTLYRDAQVHRLGPFFRALRTSLRAVAPPGVDDPRIVVMTPGPFSETAFEHASIAATLGLPLVQGRDLTVRGDRVWMRSVGRLEPVDVILRRVDGAWCDPLELRAGSQLGVPGLLEAARIGSVSVVNPVGSGVLENPGLMAFLPAIGRHLLGREPRLPSVPTWWCGEPEALRHVLANLDELVLRPALRAGDLDAIVVAELTDEQRRRLRRRLAREPHRWVGQAPPPAASVPVLDSGGLVARRSVLRTFAIARGDSYIVMPGGLTRVQGVAGAPTITGRTGAITKDTWVLASEPEPSSGLSLQSGPAARGVDPMSSIPSRAAENLWWLGRYAERAEAQTRLLRTIIDRRNEVAGVAGPAGDATLSALSDALERTTGADATLAQPIRALIDNAYAVRDQLSRDTWLVIGPLERVLPKLGAPLADGAAHSQAALGQVIQSLLALGGLGHESMVRDLGWRFMDAGRRIERALQLVSLLAATTDREQGASADSLLLEAVLSASESIITYRFRYRSQLQLATVLELMLVDPGNPRSLAFQLDRLTDDLGALRGAETGRLRPEQRIVLEASTTLRLADPDTLAAMDAAGQRPQLRALLARLQELLSGAGLEVDRVHFPQTTPSFSLIGTAGTEPEIGRVLA